MSSEQYHTQKEADEIVLKGVAASPGIAIGTAVTLKKDGIVVEERKAEPVHDLERLQKSIDRSIYELEKIYRTAVDKLGQDKAAIFEAQLLMVSDPIFFSGVKTRIEAEKKNVEFIVSDEFSKQVRQLRKSDNELFRQRAYEIEDVKNRILRNLTEAHLKSKFEGKPIVVTSDLTPADAVLLSRNEVLGYVSDFGGARSHASILSRSLGIPAVVGLKDATKHVHDGMKVILDGYRGVVVFNPTEESVRNYTEKKEWCEQLDSELLSEASEAARTTDGRRVLVEANVELLEELPLLKPHGADGIGLFRTEPLIIDAESIPDEEMQFETFRKAVVEATPNPVVFRTFDIGGDKLFVGDHDEPNPFLGWRGIRMMLDRPDMLKEQFRAILRASVFGKCRIMYPMVASDEEVVRANALLEEAKASLSSAGVAFDRDIEVGVMIEIPSAALMSKEIARHVKFLSIGTNDLTQYLLAVDRTNELVANVFDEFHPSVIRTVKLIIDSGHGAGIRVAMCGEMAGNPLATVMLLGLGLDEFSAVSSMLPVLKKIIRGTNYKSARRFARQILKLDSADDIKRLLIGYLKTHFERIYHTTISEEYVE